MAKPSFNVVTSVLVVLSALALGHYAFLRLIPPATTNALAASDQRFLSAAGHEEIEWHLIEDNPFEQAKHVDKPILLVIGLSSSRLGKKYDDLVFGDPDTARFVSQNFYCIRIDGFEHPEWLNAILPVSRLRLGLDPGFQVWTMDSQGHILSLIGRDFDNSNVDGRIIYFALIRARDEYEDAKRRGTKGALVQDMQAADLQYLSYPVVAGPSLSSFAEVLGTRCDRAHGGFPRAGIQNLYPNAWRFLTLTANQPLWQQSMAPLLLSRLVDVQDGGFFRLGLTDDISRIDFGKSTRVNAEMMLVLALQGEIQRDPFYRELAASTYDWLLACVHRNGLMPACQEDDENPQGRSPRLSFPSWRMHDVLDSDERGWTSDHLGLNPFYNAQMVPYLMSRDTLLGDPKDFNHIVGLLRRGTPDLPIFNDGGYLDVHGHTLARMIEVARLWNDAMRLKALMPSITRLNDFIRGDEVTHRPNGRTSGYLGDYLALCDARLQEYLTTGNASLLQQGLTCLNRARARFQGARPGQLNLSDGVKEMGGFPSLCVPEVADDLGESCTAQAIRLELAYGRLTADTSGGQELLRSARQTTAVFADMAGRGGPGAAGYFCGAAEAMDGLYAIAVGPDAVSLAGQLYREVPTRFVAPAVGAFRRDLQSLSPGIYIVGRTIEGPFTVDDAAVRLPLSLITVPRS